MPRGPARALAVAAALGASPRPALGHGAVVAPRPRQAIDAALSPWNDSMGIPWPIEFDGPDKFCPVPTPEGDRGNNTRLSASNGQACFWFSNGCSIGCPRCDGATRGPIPCTHPAGCEGCEEMAPPFSGKKGCQRKMHVCDDGAKATICDPALRTLNIAAECGGPTDWYYYSPWRAPGSAGVLDACGVAGGSAKAGPYGGDYTDTPLARQGDLGGALPPMRAGTVWERGRAAEVSWAPYANHGGGYQYRLAPAGGALTEETFQRMPLNFTGSQALRWGGATGRRLNISGTYVSAGTLPAGGTWAKNPIPCDEACPGCPGWTFAPPCDEVPDCLGKGGYFNDSNHCLCSGAILYNVEIVDYVLIPPDLEPGEYVLGWRWDAEESNQVWASCSDVTIR